MKSQILFVHALSPLHAGTGQGVGVVDLPVAREKATNLPLLPGSSLKGALRALGEDNTRSIVFGSSGNDSGGAAQFGDARLLLLPVRSYAGTFAWVTCPHVLERYNQDRAVVNPKTPLLRVPRPKSGTCAVAANSLLKFQVQNKPHIILEDLDLQVDPLDLAAWAKHLADGIFLGDEEGQQRLIKRLCVLPDDIFDFLAETGTEVTARIRLQEETKTVADGALWYEESLPAESILAGLVTATPLRVHEEAGLDADQVLEKAVPVQYAQFGGKAGVGRGLCRLALGGN